MKKIIMGLCLLAGIVHGATLGGLRMTNDVVEKSLDNWSTVSNNAISAYTTIQSYVVDPTTLQEQITSNATSIAENTTNITANTAALVPVYSSVTSTGPIPLDADIVYLSGFGVTGTLSNHTVGGKTISVYLPGPLATLKILDFERATTNRNVKANSRGSITLFWDTTESTWQVLSTNDVSITVP